MLPATVLTFNLTTVDFDRIRASTSALDIRLKAVPPESFTLPLGAMLGIPVYVAPAMAQGNFDEPMLLMCNLNEDQFNQFLRLMRGPGMPRVSLKAVLTPHNVGWNALQLHTELSRERENMQRQAREKR